MKKRIVSLALVVVMVLTTFLPGVGTLPVEAAETTKKEQVVVVSPWSYSDGGNADRTQQCSLMSNSDTYTEKNYEYATKVRGGQVHWDKPAMQDMDMSVYSEFRFAVKTSGNFWYEGGYNGSETEIIGNNTDWKEYVFVYTEKGDKVGYQLQSDTNVWWPADLNLSEITMKFSADDTAYLYITEIRGKLKTDATQSLKIIADTPIGSEETFIRTVGAEEPNYLATKSDKVHTSWTNDGNNNAVRKSLANVDISSCDKVLFYARKIKANEYWLESEILGSFIIGTTWTEFRLEKNADNLWDVYAEGRQRSTNQNIDNLSDITASFGEADYYFSQVFGITEQTAEITNNKEHMVVTSPWAYYKGTMANSETYAESGYEYATIVEASGTYSGFLFKDMDLSVYKEFRFAMKFESGENLDWTKIWYEVCMKEHNWGETNNIIGLNDRAWKEFVFKYDESNGVFQLYHRIGGEDYIQSKTIPANINLADLKMRVSENAAVKLYMTEVRGTLKEGATPSLEVIGDSFYDASDKYITIAPTEEPNCVATKSDRMQGHWSKNEGEPNIPFSSVDLSGYDKVVFYFRNYKASSSSNYFESNTIGASLQMNYDAWTEFKMIRNEGDTWAFYIGGNQTKSNLSINNLSEIQVSFGENNYYCISQVFGVPVAEELPEITDDLVLASPWAYHDSVKYKDEGGNTITKFSVMDKSQTYAVGGYEYATIVPGGQVYYDAPLMQDMDMSVYSEFRFAVKTTGVDSSYEVCNASTGFGENGANNIFSGNETEWMEYSFKYEDNEAGTTGYRMYKNGNRQETLLPADLNLSDLQMRFADKTSAMLYITEVRGTLKAGATSNLQIVADNFHGMGGDKDGEPTQVEEKPNGIATYSTQMKVAWRDTAGDKVMLYFPLTSLQMDKYQKVVFYTRKVEEDDWWFQSRVLGDFKVGTTWTEFRFEKATDGSWDIYVAGILKESGYPLKNLADITAAFGSTTYYFSQVFGVKSDDVNIDSLGLIRTIKASAAYKEDKTAYMEQCDFLQNDVVNWQDVQWLRQEIVGAEHEFMVATSPWAYRYGSIDNSQTYAEAGYQYATVVNGCDQLVGNSPSEDNTTYGHLLKDVDMSIYSEVRFAMKTNNEKDYWYEVCRVEDNWFVGEINTNILAGTGDWQEWIFRREIDGTGIQKFHLYEGEEPTGVWLATDSNLSEFKMKFNVAPEAVLYMTEIRGTVLDGKKLPLKVVKDTFNDKTGTVIEKDVPIIDATKVTQVDTEYSGQSGLTSVDLSSYEKILFYARRISQNHEREYWFESAVFGSYGDFGKDWIEFKIVKNDNGTWNAYTGGVLKKTNMTLTNLSDLTMAYGSNTYEFSEVFAVPVANPIMLLNAEGTTEYSVVYNNSNNEFAATEFATYMADATGVTYATETVSKIPDNDAKKIVIGADLASMAGLHTTALTTDNGYAITRKGDNLYVYGKTTQGTLNGVYALLKDAVGLEIYTDEVATDTYESGAITLKDTDKVFNPTIDYVYDMNRETRDNGAYRKKLGFTLNWDTIGGEDHEEATFLAAKDVNGESYYHGTESNGHIDLEREETPREVALYLYDRYVATTGLNNVRFGLGDDSNWFDETPAGTDRTVQYMKFMNAVAVELQMLMDDNSVNRDINLILLAYLSTVQAPTDGTSLVNTDNITLQVAYAPMEANWYVPLTDKDNDEVPSEVDSDIIYDADAQFKAWVELVGEGNVLLWTYHAFPGNYLTPFDSLNALQKNYALAAQYGAPAVYDITQHATLKALPSEGTEDKPTDKSTDWTRLKVYLSNELAKNPTMSDTEYNQLIDNFMNAYFMVEEVATAMKGALSAERTLMSQVYLNVKNIDDISRDEKCEFNDYYGTVGGYHTLIDRTKTDKGIFASANSNTRNAAWGWSGSGDHPMMEVYTKMKAAYDAVDNASIDATQKGILKERIQLEALSVRFILLRVAEVEDAHAAFEGTAGYDGLAKDCNALGVTMLGEGGRNMNADNLEADNL